MPRPLLTYSVLSLFGLILFSTSCTNRKTASLPPLELKLFVGIDRIARLNDTDGMVAARSNLLSKKIAIEGQTDLQELGFSHGLFFEDAGVRIYFRHGRVALIETQEPFNGTIQGKKDLKLFPLAKAPGTSWEESLVKEFGEPISRVAGGRFGSEALFYSWGDVSYNGVGPNQIALYRDPKIAGYRQKNFGRVLRLFPSNP